jgi:photosystem II stability/assembly factor-like uncharacterized protein
MNIMKSLTYYYAVLILFYSSIFAQEEIWKQTKGPETGYVETFARNSAGQIFAGTYQGYIYRSDNEGDSWQILNSSSAPKLINNLMIPDGTTIYAASESNGLYKSIDNGSTWDRISGSLPVTISALGKTADGDILVGTRYGSGIFKSSNGGQSWTPVNTGLGELTSQHHIKGFALSPTGSVFVCGIDTAVYKSDNNGESWDEFGKLSTTREFKGIICTANSNLLLATLGSGVYRSPINTPNWIQVNTDLENLYLYTITRPETGIEVFCGCTTGDIFKTENDGNTWTEVDGDVSNQTVKAVLAFENIILKGTSGEGIFGSTDNGGTWQSKNAGFINAMIHDLEISDSGTLYAGTQDMVYISTDDGNQWIRKFSGLPSNYVNDLLKDETNNSIFAATSYGMARSSDEGETWSLLTNGITSSASYYSVAKNSINGMIFAASRGNGMYRSEDNGDTWIEINNGLIYDASTYLHEIAFDTNGIIYVATYNYNNPVGIHKSQNNGDNWTQITVNDGQNDLNTTCIAINDKNVIFTGTSGDGIFRSSNGGNTWENVSTGLNPYINKIIFNSLGHIFAGTNNGIYRSLDNGESWHLFNAGIADSYINTLQVDNQDYIYAGTRSTGVYKTTKKTTVPTPALVSPINNKQAEQTTLNLSWESIAEATDYELQVSINPDFLDNQIDEAGIINAYRNVSNLSHDSKYFWHVRAWNNYAVSNWSEVFIFTTFKEGPQLTRPANNIVDIFPNVSFAWNPVSDVQGYELQVSFSEEFSTIQHELNNLTTNEAIIEEMGFDKIYYWRVRSIFAEGPSDWSEVYTFHTIRMGPTLIYPPANDPGMSVHINFSWRSVLDAIGYQLQVASDSLFTNFIVNRDSIGGIEQLEKSFEHSQKYFWRVRAHFGNGSSAWSEVRTFTTLRVGPELNSPNDNQTGVSNTVNFYWNTVTSAIEYHIQVSTDITFSSPEYDKDQITSTNYQITNLPYSNTYYWHVRALFDDGLYSDWSEIRSFRTILAPINLIAPSNDQTDITFPIVFSWNGSPYASSYWLQISTEDDFDPLIVNNSDISLTSFQIVSLNFDTQYFWRVAGMDNGAAGAWSNTWRFDTQKYPSTVNANTTIQFPTYNEPKDYQATDYRLFGLPGNSDLTFDQVFGSGAGEQWIAYYDEYDTGNSNNVFVKFMPDDGRFRFSQGKGFWVLNKGQLKVDINITSAILNDQNRAHITLHNGWNIITNPFPFTVSWQAVCDLNELGSIPLYNYNGSFNTSTMLEPYQGYYIDNQSNKPDIFVPYIESVGKIAGNTNNLNWQLTIILNSGKFEDAATWLGISDKANAKIDELDYRKPRAIGKVPKVYFDRSEWGDKWVSMTSDIRPKIAEKEIWDFDVDVPSDQKARLSFSGVENIPAEFKVYLIDRTKLRTIDLRLENQYIFTAITDHCKFAIIIGNEIAVEQELQSIIPMKFVLGSNYPNPFNPETVIPIELPEASEISLKIYNILGEEVRTLFHGSLETGRHLFTWDGTNQAGQRCPSGIYLYHMEGQNGFKASRRMILIK